MTIQTQIKTLAAACALLIAPAVQAQSWQPDRVFMPLASYHANLDARDYGRDTWSEINPGVILSWRDRFLGLNYNAGVFRNSFADWAAYGAVAKAWQLGEDLELSALMGLADYGDNAPLLDDRLTRVVPILGVQATSHNTFFQIQPVRTEDGMGAIFVTGISLDLK